MEEITTERFRVPRRVYERYVATRWTARRWWIIVVPILAAGLASAVTADVRWLLVALIYLFIVSPGIVSIAYFKYLLTPEARLNALDKQLIICPGHSIDIIYSMPKEEEDDEREPWVEIDPPGTETYDNDAWLPPDETITWEHVQSVTISGSNYVFNLRSARWPRFIIVPRSVLSDPLPFDILSKR